ncbi:hypothetical protein MHYP_G00276890 [Metynnis hypsauchen]
MASVLRWAVMYWTLTQIIVFCGPVQPVHIQLNLDGKEIIKDEEDYDRLPNEKYDTLEKITGLVKMWYNFDDAAKPMYIDPGQRDLVEKAQLIKLYVRGKFLIEEMGCDFLWDNKRKGARELAKFVLRIFKGKPVVIVVFPDDLQTYTGFKFQKEFEEQNGLKVGSHTAKDLTDILLKLLRVQDVETHPEQRIRVELPETCGTAKEREAFTGNLIDNLENKELKVYGKEPSVHIHVYRNERQDDKFDKAVNHIKQLHQQDIVREMKTNGIISITVFKAVTVTDVFNSVCVRVSKEGLHFFSSTEIMFFVNQSCEPEPRGTSEEQKASS